MVSRAWIPNRAIDSTTAGRELIAKRWQAMERANGEACRMHLRNLEATITDAPSGYRQPGR